MRGSVAICARDSTWQTRDLAAEGEEELHAPVVAREAGLGGAVRQIVVLRDELELRQQVRQAIQLRLRQPEHLPDLARSGARAIADHVRGHRRARLPEALVDVLDDLLALVTGGQIEVDVRPALLPTPVTRTRVAPLPLRRKESFEEESHADRIDGGDAG